MKRWVRCGGFLAAAALFALNGCGGYGGGGGSDYQNPTGPTGGGGGSITSGATITIGANGVVSPASVTIDRGQSVTFVNSHNAAHDVSSNPHPDHTDCPPLNTIGRLVAGQTKATSSAFTTARTCGFHDHDDPDNRNLQGSIVVR
jgi:plastocyanin